MIFVQSTPFTILKHFVRGVAAASLVLVISTAAVAGQPTLKTPYTYTIDYGVEFVRTTNFDDAWGDSPARMFHAGNTPRTLGPAWVAFTPTKGELPTGTSDGPYTEDEAGVRAWHDEVRAFTKHLHDSGLKWLIPYYCSQTAYGRMDRRLGLWNIYDKWEVYQPYGLGPKPDRDPILWMQRDELGQLKFNYPFNTFLMRGNSDSVKRYAPCMSDRDWIEYSKGDARSIARDGYDGMFVDNCIQHSYAPHAQAAYREWLRTQYSPESLREDLGYESFEEACLYHEGDLIRWAVSFDDFIPWLEEEYPVEERNLYFNCVGPLDATAVNAAGDGFLIGKTEEFIRERAFKDRPDATWEEVRGANPALQTPQGKTRWAKTKKFWSASAAKWLEVVRDAAREVNPDFFMVPNWGSMERIIGTLGRSETGKDLALYAKACPTQMFEEGQDVAQVVPGVISHFHPGFKLAFQNGVTAAHFAYDNGGSDSSALRHAEAAAYGSVCVLAKKHIAVQQRYQDFFDTHGDWYEGYVSAAPVGLLHMYDQVYFDNQRHLVALDQIHNMLGRWQIAFDHVIESDLDVETLSRYRALVVPVFSYVSDGQLDALTGYVENGGCLIVVGDFADRDDAARTRNEFPPVLAEAFARGESSIEAGKIVYIPTLVEAVADPGIPYEKALQAANSATELVPENRSERGDFFRLLDRQFGLQRFRNSNPVVEALRSVFGEPTNFLDVEEGEDLRLTFYRHPETGDRIVHLLNYRLPLNQQGEDRKIQRVNDLAVSIPIGSTASVSEVTVAIPGAEDKKIEDFQVKEGVLSLRVPEFGEYALVRVSGR